jgi:hypothetical protein
MNYPTTRRSQLIWREMCEMLFASTHQEITTEWMDTLYYAYSVNDLTELFTAAVGADVINETMNRNDEDGENYLATLSEPFITMAIESPMAVPNEDARAFIFMMLLRYPTSNLLSLLYDEMREMMTLALSAPLLPWETLRAAKENDIDIALANAL